MQQAIPIVRELLSPALAFEPTVEDVLDDIALLTTRMGISVVLFDDPSTTRDDALRAFLYRWLPLSMTVPPESRFNQLLFEPAHAEFTHRRPSIPVTVRYR